MGKIGPGKVKLPPVPVSIAEPAPALERVKCNCPEYKGSDFWNDPHRWCDRDRVTQKVWEDKQERDCERTYRPRVFGRIP